MMMFGRLLLAAALSFAALPAVAQTKPKVVATFSILGDLVAQVGGDRIDLAVLVGADTDAHTYQPKPTDARTLAAAQAMVSNGLGFEGWIDRLAEAAPFKGRPIVATAGVPTLEARRPATATRTAPIRIAGRMSAARAATSPTSPTGLAEADPANAAPIASARGLRPAARRRSTTGSGARSPRCRQAQRKAITGHDSFRYFAAAPMACSSGAARLQHRQRAVGASDVAGADPPGARAEDQGAVRREHDQPRPGRPRSPANRAPWSARASTATRCRRPAARRRPTRR